MGAGKEFARQRGHMLRVARDRDRARASRVQVKNFLNREGITKAGQVNTSPFEKLIPRIGTE